MLSVFQSVLIVLCTIAVSVVFFSSAAARMAGDATDGTQLHYWLADQRTRHNVRRDSRVYALECVEQFSDCACDDGDGSELPCGSVPRCKRTSAVAVDRSELYAVNRVGMPFRLPKLRAAVHPRICPLAIAVARAGFYRRN